MNNLTILDEGRSDTIDPLSSFEMSNILGGAEIDCKHGYCAQNYSDDGKGSIFCGCGYVKPGPVDKPTDPIDPINPIEPEEPPLSIFSRI